MNASLNRSGLDLPMGLASPVGLCTPERATVFCILRGSSVPDNSVQSFPVTTSPYRIGRRPDNHLCLGNPTVSGYHAQVAYANQRIWVEDLHSTNGTFLNGHRLTEPTEARNGNVLQFGSARFEVLRHSEAISGATLCADVAGQALADLQFLRLIEDPAVEPYYQPIVRLQDAGRVGFEVLARSRLVGLETPASMFRVAIERRMEVELSQILRQEGIDRGRAVGQGLQLYVNTHPSELERPGLIESMETLRRAFPEPAIILEIHEAAITSLAMLRQLRPRLTELNIGLAYDDFGAGQARLLELTEVPPDVIKFDMALVQNLDSAPAARQRMVSSLVEVVKSLGVIALAEGVETAAEAAACVAAGFELAQGFYYGHPAPAAHWLAP